jgi:hypothetical protein
MEWIKKNPEKLIAILFGLAGIGVGAKNILEVTGLPDRYVIPKAAAKAELPTPEIGVVDQSAAILKAPFNWSDKQVQIGSGAQKMVPLFRSVTIIEKDGKLFDLADPTEESIRPPVENDWLEKYDLDLLYSGVLEADPDSDGYVTLDEWKAKTSPIESNSHPPYWLKLMFVDRKQQNFTLTFAADNDPKFQINIINRGARSPAEFPAVGETFFNGRFKVISYEKKEGLNSSGIKANQSTLKLKDNSNGADIVLEFRKEQNYPTYFGEFNFTLDPNQKQFYVRLGDTFTLQKEPAVTYKLEAIDPAGGVATLKLSDGTTVTLNKGVLPEVPVVATKTEK